MSAEIREAIRDQALAMGFDAVGFAAAHVTGQARAALREFLTHGHHGDMGWLAEKADRRGDPQVLWPEARSIVALGINYGPDADPLRVLDMTEAGGISVYARNRDYHDIVKKRLKALARWIAARWPGDLKVFVDTAPVMEKPLAAAAGIGWQGKHTNLVSREFGSWLFLGEIYLSLELAPDEPETDHCGLCRRCLDACPTDAFLGPYRLDARRCISYLTIEHKGPIPHELRPLIGNRIYGCDDCLAVCPWNKFARVTDDPGLAARPELNAPRLVELARLDDTAFRAMFAGSPVKRIGRDRFLRNVLIAIGNVPQARPELVAVVRDRLDDASALVRGAAVWAFARLATAADIEAAQNAHRHETDAAVRDEWSRVTAAVRVAV